MNLLARLKNIEPALPACIAVASAITLLGFLLQGHLAIATQEEGFLWYGVEAVERGDWPLRDFRSYDPGRYFWCAALAHVFGDGIVGLRAACAVFAAVGLTAALLVVRRVVPSGAWILPAGVLIALWQFPGWRPFEAGLASMATWFAMRFVERPTARWSFAAGMFTGLAAFFGRNHGLYAATAFVLLQGFVFAAGTRTGFVRRAAALAGGVVVGSLPMLALVVLVPGFAQAFVDSILFYVGRKSLNIPYPATWPWSLDTARLTGIELVSAAALSLFFVLYVVGYAWLGLVVLLGRLGGVARSPAIVAALCVGLPYVHHVAERSDVHHVAASIPPLLLGVLALGCAVSGPRAHLRTAMTLALMLLASLFAIGTEQPLGRRWLDQLAKREHVALEVRGDTLVVSAGVARRIDAVRRHIEQRVPPEAKLLLSSKLLVLYPMLRRAAPVWDVYPCWPASPDHEQRMLDELSTVDWVFIHDVAVGGAEELRFARMYPAAWLRLEQDYERIPTPDLPADFIFLQRR